MISKSIVTVRYAETDKMGIVHHSVYPIWFELARTDLSEQAGFPYSKMEETGIMLPLVELNCKYHSPAYYGDKLIVTSTVSKLTPARIVFSYEVYRDTTNNLNRDNISHSSNSINIINVDMNNKPLCIGETVHAIVNTNMRPINTKKLFPEVYAAMEKMMN